MTALSYYLNPCWHNIKAGLALDISKIESWMQMGHTANIIIKHIHIFALWLALLKVFHDIPLSESACELNS